MKVLKLWACTANTDTTEGRGSEFDVCFAKDKETALAIVNKPSYYGRYGCMGCKPYKNGEFDVSERTLIIYNSEEEFKGDMEEIMKKKALKKLTKKEKELLGLEED